MAEPPRLKEIKLPGDADLIYFVTLCVDGRHKCLANAKVFAAIQKALGQLRNWSVHAGVIMPDHAHFMVAPSRDRGISVGDFATGLKRLLRKELNGHEWNWQRGCFDRLLRSGEDAQNKWTYLEQNPVRAGLVKRVQDWPYYFGSLAEAGS